mmetsp:Transcript_14237/g.41776  ORF Transcript_14237/g.41776 Transcript_14237/m.41776 type:complete len:291 (+) Transcript_14237:1395-2267(+)
MDAAQRMLLSRTMNSRSGPTTRVFFDKCVYCSALLSGSISSEVVGICVTELDSGWTDAPAPDIAAAPSEGTPESECTPSNDSFTSFDWVNFFSICLTAFAPTFTGATNISLVFSATSDAVFLLPLSPSFFPENMFKVRCFGESNESSWSFLQPELFPKKAFGRDNPSSLPDSVLFLKAALSRSAVSSAPLRASSAAFTVASIAFCATSFLAATALSTAVTGTEVALPVSSPSGGCALTSALVVGVEAVMLTSSPSRGCILVMVSMILQSLFVSSLCIVQRAITALVSSQR